MVPSLTAAPTALEPSGDDREMACGYRMDQEMATFLHSSRGLVGSWARRKVARGSASAVRSMLRHGSSLAGPQEMQEIQGLRLQDGAATVEPRELYS